MDKDDLLAQLTAHLQATVREARLAMEAAAVEAREGATPAEKREDSRVALEQGGLARGHKARMDRAVVTPTSPVGRAVMGCRQGDVVEIVAAGQKREWTITYVA